MGKGTKFILIVILLAIVGLAIYVGAQENNKVNNNTQNNSNSVNEVNNNKRENTVVDDNNQVSEPPVEPTPSGTPENIVNSTTISEEDKAKELAKLKWGGTEGVYFAIDNVNSDETYVVSVRDSATTKVLEWYTVNIKTGTVTN